MVGNVGIGGENPIRVQSMTTTDTLNVEATTLQALRMAEAGCEIIRITAPTPADAKALGKIKEGLLKKGVNVPLVADIHFSPAAAMEAAEYVEKVRINPGNFVDTKRFSVKEYTDAEYAKEIERIEERFTPLVEKLKRLKRVLRIGANHGSLSDRIMNRYGDSPLGMVESALEFVRICEKNGFHDIVLSMKASNPKIMIAAYRLLAARMNELGMDYPFHLGVTEAGGGEDGRIKSAIGIGSLLADGIGDTIRVSLTEDPEFEIPVCYALAKPYQQKPNKKASPCVPRSRSESVPKHLQEGRYDSAEDAGLKYTPDFYSYARRASAILRVGPFMIGKDNPVRVITSIPSSWTAPQILSWFESQLKSGNGADPEILAFKIKNPAEAKAFIQLRTSLAPETSRLAFLGRFETLDTISRETLKHFDLISWTKGSKDFPAFCQEAVSAGTALLIEGRSADETLQMAELAQKEGLPVLLSLQGQEISCVPCSRSESVPNHLQEGLYDSASLIYEYRKLAAKAALLPIHIHAPHFEQAETRLLESSVLTGSLLSDGLGDSFELSPLENPKDDLRLSYDILQGAQSRITKTEFVSCPSCGRTLFDLQTTTERIKNKTGHLKGVKIAIMGCIVNGPGEMADADFGYVGGAPDKINLYVGKECVKKGVPTTEAVQALIDLIKVHGKWVEP